MKEFLETPTVAVFRSFKKAEFLALTTRLGLTHVNVAMRKPEIRRVIAEYYYDEEVFTEAELELCPPFER